MATPSVPYIGSRIVLISKSEIRYEGTLGSVDTAASTVKLHQVRSFGTEDRKTEGVIPASSQIYEYIIFRGADIKDLHVCESTASQPAAATSVTSAAPEQAPEALPPRPAAAASEAAPAWGANPSQASAVAPAPAAPRTQGQNKARGGRAQPGMPRPAPNGSANGHAEEYDIQAMLAGFDKAAVMQEASERVKTTTAYNPKVSMFDTLDEEVAEEGGRKGGRAFRAEMRKNDISTFGEDMIKEADRRARSKGSGRRDTAAVESARGALAL
ncbi:hypothetical protein EMIHUDRAFT_449431 [Emiliania huxleyi CCMP1516]|uniref:Lsm14-like N-terminal domain-containing protein n=2 Tax=Emiliania huxleyi TaxID=2903 RepID=A0A0D3KBN3_EMIH1|nr:hypothetical protein EMIHUDRAFT_449431 [Emiliania huxleyi CCMP1516]EOD33168.1 hypothetical protein EMIHUDRAFT_449431 [Emiliania huxleyi CCMP1516]|eukprot:XP_005785597.1 hypothetical protein EMIHUDRAFT_449431 [Emiliania huxleyi CCMP1516]